MIHCDAAVTVDGNLHEKRILPSPFAGSWYPASPAELKKLFGEWFAAAPEPPKKTPAAILLPHAGYVYSGKTAAAAAACVLGKKYSRVVILAPSHRVYMRNKLCIPKADAVSTPLGSVEIDRSAADLLAKNPFVVSDDSVHLNEHSAQLEIPFLQYALQPGFKVLPVIYGVFEKRELAEAAEILSVLFEPGTLVVVSSDFTHYGPNYDYVPFKKEIRENLRKLDLGAFALIEKKDASGFGSYIDSTGATICGATGIEMLLRTLPSNAECIMRGYANSSEMTGETDNSVSYLSAAFYCEWGSPGKESGLTDSDKTLLLKLARASIARQLDGSAPLPDLSALSPAAERKMGAFVTLKINGQLRGCIGEILPYRKLVNAVRARAVDAAFSDPRFMPLRKEELSRIDIEISALTVPHAVASWRDIVVGKHGIVLTKRGRSAVFLPQVAPEQGWGIEETLTNLSLKAGLGPDDWREGASFEVFEAIVFGEK